MDGQKNGSKTICQGRIWFRKHKAIISDHYYYLTCSFYVIILTTFEVNINIMSQNHLGEFEEIVLLTVEVLHGEAYGIAIIDEIEARLKRKVSIGSLQTTLRRLEKKGFLNSEFGEATKVRGGKRKRYFTVTNFGRSALEESKDARIGLWNAIPNVAFE